MSEIQEIPSTKISQGIQDLDLIKDEGENSIMNDFNSKKSYNNSTDERSDNGQEIQNSNKKHSSRKKMHSKKKKKQSDESLTDNNNEDDLENTNNEESQGSKGIRIQKSKKEHISRSKLKNTDGSTPRVKHSDGRNPRVKHSDGRIPRAKNIEGVTPKSRFSSSISNTIATENESVFLTNLEGEDQTKKTNKKFLKEKINLIDEKSDDDENVNFDASLSRYNIFFF